MYIFWFLPFQNKNYIFVCRLQLKDPFFPKPRSGASGGIYPGSTKFFVHQGTSDNSHFDTVMFDLNTEEWSVGKVNLG